MPEHTFESSDHHATIKSVLDPPQDSASREAAVDSLSNAALAAAWARVSRDPVASAPLLAEFRRRYWVEQIELARSCSPLRLEPSFRPLARSLADRETCGVDPFARGL